MKYLLLLIGPVLACFVAWLEGYDFDTRGSDAVVTFLGCIVSEVPALFIILNWDRLIFDREAS